ncbi:MAG: hypothetical protein Q8K65_03270 [Alphaproteobacteria bacterium]|nr:hypothetical protein [Alphaproteobacteria bacterium]
MKRALKIAFATVAATALLTGCDSRNYNIGHGAERDELKGSVRQEQVFTGGPEQTHTTLRASFLESGRSYRVTGALTIEGDIPEKASIIVYNGELTVNGKVGNDASLRVNVPLVTHTKTSRGPGYCYKMNGSYGYSNFCRKTKTIVDGLKYDDPDPAIRITGTTGENVRLSTDGAIEVRGRNVQPPRHPVYKTP